MRINGAPRHKPTFCNDEKTCNRNRHRRHQHGLRAGGRERRPLCRFGRIDQEIPAFHRLSGLCGRADRIAACAGRQPLVRIRAGGHRHRRAQRQLPHGRDRTPGQPVEVPRRRNQSRREPPHVPAGGRHQEGVPGRRVPDDQRRQRRHDRRDDLRQRQGDEGFHHDHARDGTRFGIRRQWRDDLRPRRLRRRIRPRDRRAGRPPVRLRTPAAVWKPTFRPPASSAPFSN